MKHSSTAGELSNGPFRGRNPEVGPGTASHPCEIIKESKGFEESPTIMRRLCLSIIVQHQLSYMSN